MGRPATSASPPQPRLVGTLADALWAEYQALHDEAPPARAGRDFGAELDAYYAAARAKQQAALCLSGGGIRSAAFALGVLQGLAERGLLKHFHYLSTVSGGGYIGGWLTALIRAHDGDVGTVEQHLAAQLAPPELGQLRAYTNFLTPRPGLVSPDTWAGFMLWLRNVLVNWMLFVPALFTAAMLPVLYRDVLITAWPSWGWPLLLIGLGCVYCSTRTAALHLPSHRNPPGPGQRAGRQAEASLITSRIVAPALAWSAIAPVVVAPSLPPVLPDGVLSTALIPLGSFAAMLAGYLAASRDREGADRAIFARNFGWWTLSALLSALLLEIGIALTPQLPVDWLAVAGPLGVMLAYLAQTLFYVALRREANRADLDREWLARLSALKVVPAALWAIFAAACVLLPAHLGNWGFGTGGLLSGPLAAWLGNSARSRLNADTDPAKAGSRFTLSVNVLIAIATSIFAALLFATLARGGDWFAAAFAPGDGGDTPRYRPLVDAVVAAVAFLVAWRLGRRVNVNRFSMHAVYRNRLTRAFLGTARRRRTPDPFTGLDANDNPRMKDLFGRPSGQRVLFPVINVALNLVAGRNTAWIERKAMSFTITPLACGAAYLQRREDARVANPVRGAYVKTFAYAGIEKETGPDDTGTGMTLGTAMTISGAAVSPAMGYHSSAPVAFLMTLFNVRLGAWLPNPAVGTAGDLLKGRPRNALFTLGRELLGLIDDTRPDVYLSDGGHFEDLGLYEMIRRRCSHILVVDAGADPEAGFSDLGNAVRKILIDQDVRITFDPPMRIGSRARPEPPVRGFALASIAYPEGGAPGTLLYIRPCDPADVPIDVRAYRNASPTFPHETTLDQWFTESQFESYRRLGLHEVESLGGPARGGPADAPAPMQRFFDTARATLEPPPGVAAA